jgi:hypothetical protein
MNSTPIQHQSVLKGEFCEPPPLSKPNCSYGYELHPSLKAMVRAQPFSGYDNEDPFNHLQEFEEMCSCMSIPGMTQDIIMWKLFPFSLEGEAKQWYTYVVGSMNGDWEKLKDKFCLVSFPMSRINSLPRAILDFEQNEKESIGAT